MLRVDPAACTDADLATAVTWLRAGKLVAYPTDTFYGLAADSAHGLNAACACDSDHQSRKQQRRDDGLNEPEKNGPQ